MSHWTKVKTKLREIEYIKKALTRMGLAYTEGNHTISQYGTKEKAEIKLDDAVGLSRQEDGTWAMVGDFYHSHNQGLRKYYGRNDLFNTDLGTNYAVEQAKGQLEEQQFFCSENEEAKPGQDGLIRMTFERYA
jgi:hypothetical protein